jgi:hypothetical protein
VGKENAVIRVVTPYPWGVLVVCQVCMKPQVSRCIGMVLGLDYCSHLKFFTGKKSKSNTVSDLGFTYLRTFRTTKRQSAPVALDETCCPTADQNLNPES